jgi:hypothetical protein
LLGGLVFGGHGNEVKDARNTRPPAQRFLAFPSLWLTCTNHHVTRML